MRITGPGIWGDPEDPAEAVRVLRRAVELGVTFIDTADSYGPFVSEQLIRQALHPYPDDLVIATKGGLTRSGPGDWRPVGRPEYLRQQTELSLRHLGVERIDLYQLHRIDAKVPLAEQLGELALLQQEGKIRHIGVSEVSIEQLKQAREIAEIVSVQNLYNLANRKAEDVLAVWPDGADKAWNDTLTAALAELRPEVYQGWKSAQLTAALKPHPSVTVADVGRRIDGKAVTQRGIARADVLAAVTERDRKRSAG